MHIHDKAFYFALFFILGIASASFGMGIWISLLASAIFSHFILRHKKILTLIFIAITFTGYFYLHLYDVLQRENIPLEAQTYVEGIVFREPIHGLKSEQIDIRLKDPHKGEVRIYTDPSERYSYGDIVSISGVIEKSPTGRLNTSSFPEIEIIGTGGGNIVVKNLFSFKDRMSINLKRVLPPEHATLMSGILFGERAEFTEDLKESMRKSGTTHIVALSGYNVAIIGITFSTALAYVMSRRHAFYISMVAIPAFVLMTGAQSSVVRAGIMGMILLIAERQSRIYSFRNAITLTALAMLLINPRLLVFDVGFQLSFAALIGIVYVYPFLKKKFKVSEKEGILGWRRNLLQTFSAQLAVAPIALLTFGFFSPTALIANVLILEFIPLTMLFGFLTAILGFILIELSLVLGWITSIFLSYEIFIIKFFGLTWF